MNVCAFTASTIIGVSIERGQLCQEGSESLENIML